MQRSPLLCALVCGLVLGTSSATVDATQRTRPKEVPAAETTPPKKPRAALDDLGRIATKLAQRPNLKDRMTKHRASVASLRIVVRDLDRLVAEVSQKPPKDPRRARENAEKLKQQSFQLLQSLAAALVDVAKNESQKAADLWRLSLATLREHAERQAQAVNVLTST